MDEQMRTMLKSQGWSESLGRDSKGGPTGLGHGTVHGFMW